MVMIPLPLILTIGAVTILGFFAIIVSAVVFPVFSPFLFTGAVALAIGGGIAGGGQVGGQIVASVSRGRMKMLQAEAKGELTVCVYV